MVGVGQCLVAQVVKLWDALEGTHAMPLVLANPREENLVRDGVSWHLALRVLKACSSMAYNWEVHPEAAAAAAAAAASEQKCLFGGTPWFKTGMFLKTTASPATSFVPFQAILALLWPIWCPKMAVFGLFSGQSSLKIRPIAGASDRCLQCGSVFLHSLIVEQHSATHSAKWNNLWHHNVGDTLLNIHLQSVDSPIEMKISCF